MYNSYISDDFYFKQFSDKPDVINTESGETIIPSNTDEKAKSSLFSGMVDNIKFPEITGETLILFAVIFFSIYDDFDMDLIIILGVLFLLGL